MIVSAGLWRHLLGTMVTEEQKGGARGRVGTEKPLLPLPQSFLNEVMAGLGE